MTQPIGISADVPAGFVGKLLYTEDEAAGLLSLCKRTLFSLRKSGKIKHTQIGVRILYHASELSRFASDSIGQIVSV